ncbi:MAG: sigma 54-interacting transcriptional regulator [Syntrophaceticus sp.]
MAKSLENILSPMIANRNVLTQSLNQQDLILMEKIKQQKLDVIHQRISSSQVDLVRSEVVESWIRSYNYGLDLFNYNYGPVLEETALEELLRKNDLLLNAADPYISQLETMLSDSECIILLTDEEGVMLRVIEGGKKILEQQNKRFRLVPGSIWTEETIGTCAHGISLITKTPMQICGSEHYCEKYEQISCSSAPIFDSNGNLAGTLCIVSPSFKHQTSHSLGLVISMAWAVQNEFQLALNKELLSVTLETTDEAVITTNKDGIINKANLPARKILNYINKDLVGMSIESILGKQSIIKSVLETGKSISNTVILYEKTNQRLHLHSVQPIKDQYGNIYGCVLTFNQFHQARKLVNQNNGLKATYTFDDIIGNSHQLKKSIDIAKKFAHLNANLLIQGESGTGKELFAQAIHNESRPNGPFIALNCAAIPHTLIESELFGYEGGAFTGAKRHGKQGKIELADGGTLFLDEIGDLPMELQPVLLRVLEEGKVMRIGANHYVPVDFRLITATNKNLLHLVEKGQFREDLYYRLKALTINIPPLRDRETDILILAQHFINATAKKQQKTAPSLSELTALEIISYSWPGNIRQLENAMFYAVSICTDGVIKPDDLPEDIHRGVSVTSNQIYPEHVTPDRAENNFTLKNIERIMIHHVLQKTNNNISKAAEQLGISRSTLYRKIEEYKLLNDA